MLAGVHGWREGLLDLLPVQLLGIVRQQFWKELPQRAIIQGIHSLGLGLFLCRDCLLPGLLHGDGLCFLERSQVLLLLPDCSAAGSCHSFVCILDESQGSKVTSWGLLQHFDQRTELVVGEPVTNCAEECVAVLSVELYHRVALELQSPEFVEVPVEAFDG